jgi:hypothetical protein
LPAFRQKVVSLTPKPLLNHNRRSAQILAKMEPAFGKMTVQAAPEGLALPRAPRSSRERPTVMDNNNK